MSFVEKLGMHTFVASKIDFGIDTLQLILNLFSPFYGISSLKTSVSNDFCLKNMLVGLQRACLDRDKAPLFHFFPPLGMHNSAPLLFCWCIIHNCTYEEIIIIIFQLRLNYVCVCLPTVVHVMLQCELATFKHWIRSHENNHFRNGTYLTCACLGSQLRTFVIMS